MSTRPSDGRPGSSMTPHDISTFSSSIPEASNSTASNNMASSWGPATNEPPTPMEESLSSQTATVTITETRPPSEEEVLTLTLRPRPSVTWDEDVVDNEGLGRKSSKRCCIFHKQRPFGESSTDSSDYDSDESGRSSSSSSSSEGGPQKSGGSSKKWDGRTRKNRKVARPKKNKKVPDFQRYHA